jgi:hypothetical protein
MRRDTSHAAALVGRLKRSALDADPDTSGADVLTALTKAEDSTEDSTTRAFVTLATALSRSTARLPLSHAERNAPGRNRTCRAFPRGVGVRLR